MTGRLCYEEVLKRLIPTQEQLDACKHSPKVEEVEDYIADHRFMIFCRECYLLTSGPTREEVQKNWNEGGDIRYVYPY